LKIDKKKSGKDILTEEEFDDNGTQLEASLKK
jgi:hypothetical protein